MSAVPNPARCPGGGARAFITVLLIALSAGVSRAEPPPPPAPGDPAALMALYQEGLAAFDKGDYQKTVANLRTIIAQAGPDAQLEPVYFTLGAACYNMQDMPGAVEAFTTYLGKFPKGERATDALLSLGRANLQLKHYPEALASFQKLEEIPQTREQALVLEAFAQKESGQEAAAIATWEKLTSSGLTSQASVNGAIQLAAAYAARKESDKASAMLEKIRQRRDLVDDYGVWNTLLITVGDGFLQAGNASGALTCYREVRSPSEILQLQDARIAEAEAAIRKNLAARQGAQPSQITTLVAQQSQLRTALADAMRKRADYEKLPDATGGLLQRMARAYYESGQRWEAITIYDELLRRGSGADEEPVLFGMVIASAEVNRLDKCGMYAERYLKTFPDGPNTGMVAYLQGAAAMQKGDLAAAESCFGKMLKAPTDKMPKEEVLFLLANVYFELGKYEDAAQSYQDYTVQYPSGTHAAECAWRTGLARLFAGQYEAAMKALESCLKAYPTGPYAADAKYRLAVCKLAASLYDEVLADCASWEKEFPGHPALAEINALRGDALAAQGRTDAAIDAYVASFQQAANNETLNYSLGELARLMEKTGQWERLGKTLQAFVSAYPDHPSAVTASFWIGRSMSKLGRQEEAKQFLADVIRTNISDPASSSVDQLISQYVQLCARRKTGNQPQPGATPADPNADIDALAGGITSDTARARVLSAKATLSQLRRHPGEDTPYLKTLSESFSPADLSEAVLAQVGDYLLSQKQWDKAGAVFQQLRNGYPKGNYLDYAYNGLAEIAYARQDYTGALKLFSEAIDRGVASQKLREITVGQARSLLALGRLDEARKKFEEIAATREWRGEATALSVYSLGEIEEKQGRLPEAIAYYQRVYVGYGRYLPWVAKAYVRSAECFQKIGKKEEAMNTYREMIRNEKLSGFSEYQTALKQMEGGNG